MYRPRKLTGLGSIYFVLALQRASNGNPEVPSRPPEFQLEIVGFFGFEFWMAQSVSQPRDHLRMKRHNTETSPHHLTYLLHKTAAFSPRDKTLYQEQYEPRLYSASFIFIRWIGKPSC
jgi:hypothetical protein